MSGDQSIDRLKIINCFTKDYVNVTKIHKGCIHWQMMVTFVDQLLWDSSPIKVEAKSTFGN